MPQLVAIEVLVLKVNIFLIFIKSGAEIIFQIIIEAIRGMSVRSDIAIDDIKFQAGSCAGNNSFPNYLSLTEKRICNSFKS